MYTLALLAVTLATALLIAPSMYHRLNFRRGVEVKERMLYDSNRLLVAGTLCTAVGISCSVYLVADVVHGGLAAALATLATVAVLGLLWVGLPVRRRLGREREP